MKTFSTNNQGIPIIFYKFIDKFKFSKSIIHKRFSFITVNLLLKSKISAIKFLWQTVTFVYDVTNTYKHQFNKLY